MVLLAVWKGIGVTNRSIGSGRMTTPISYGDTSPVSKADCGERHSLGKSTTLESFDRPCGPPNVTLTDVACWGWPKRVVNTMWPAVRTTRGAMRLPVPPMIPPGKVDFMQPIQRKLGSLACEGNTSTNAMFATPELTRSRQAG